MSRQADLFTTFTTAEPAHPLYCHQDFLQKVEENRRTALGKRAALLLERLAVDPRREFFKVTSGANRGWRRSRLGGHGGSHFYAWWAPKGALPLRDADGFDATPDGSVFLRDIRHHDDHAELRPQSLNENYLPLTVRDLRGQEYVPSPLTANQAQFANARNRVRVVKGYPGSGKTTALWHAADAASVESVLYVTYSNDLAALARTHFLRFGPAHKDFQVYTLARLVREWSGCDLPVMPVAESRRCFLKQLAGLSPRVVGPWVEDRSALYDELHANMVGAALPVAVGRFAACERPRLPDRVYRDQRRRFVGGPAADAALEVFNTLEKRHSQDFYELFFPELLLAWKSAAKPAPEALLGFDCLAVDEAQDLTPVEALAVAQLAAANPRRRSLSVLVAGDEGQTVRPTDFDWGWFHDLLHHTIGSPQEFQLPVNLRSPRRIARLINAVSGLYGNIAKHTRPGGTREAEIEDEASDQLAYCAAIRGPELEALLRTLAAREGLAIIRLQPDLPAYVPEDIHHAILSPAEAKGLDFQAVCVLDAGRRLTDIVSRPPRRDHDVDPLSIRLAIDQMRVAVSRPTERIYFLDVDPTESGVHQFLSFLRHADPDSDLAPVIPAVLLKSLEEELLDPEERVRLCENDALQFLDVKPEMAWVRARQAVSLLGREGSPNSVADPEVRRSAHVTLTRVAFCLAFREVRLPRELGDPDLWDDASTAADAADRPGLSALVRSAARLRAALRTTPEIRLAELQYFMTTAAFHWNEVESWLALELTTRAPGWLKEMEAAATDPEAALLVQRALPAAYKLYAVPDAEERLAQTRRTAIERLIAAERFKTALEVLATDPEASPLLVAQCREGAGDHPAAADLFRSLGKNRDALRNYRAIPDIAKALELVRELGEQPALEGLEWIQELQRLLDARPKNFARAATAAEKKFVADLLEANLGRPRTPKPPRAKAAPKSDKKAPKTTARKPRGAKLK